MRPTRAELALLVLIVVVIAFAAWARNVAVRGPTAGAPRIGPSPVGAMALSRRDGGAFW